MVLSPAHASATGFSNGYCGVLINEDSWCGDGSNHSYDYNRAEYRGRGSVWVCERLMLADDPNNSRSGPSCAYNYAAHNYGETTSLFEAEVGHLFSDGAMHTIYGYATA